MFSNTRSRTSTESTKSKNRILATFALPSFRFEFEGIFIIFFIEMIPKGLYSDSSPFFNRHVCNKMVSLCDPSKNTCSWAITSRCLILNPIDVSQFFKVFFVDIFIRLNKLIDFFPKSFLNVFILCNKVYHHLSEMTRSLSSTCKECTKLVNQFIEIVTLRLFHGILFPFRVYLIRVKVSFQN